VVLPDLRLSEDLLTSIDELDRWPEKVRLMQKNWIGRSEGLRVRWEFTEPAPTGDTTLEIYTTRPDTLYGASFMGLSPDHPISAGSWPRTIPRSRNSSRSAITSAPLAEAIETAEKIGHRHRLAGDAPA
jgi:leucyl-tRNA synthetase